MEGQITWIFTKKAGWIRFNDVTLQYKNTEPLFSERYGHEKFYHLPFTSYRIRIYRESI